MEGRVLLSVNSQGVTPQLDHPLYGGVLVLHGGVHERSVASDGVAHVLQRVGAQLWVRTFLQTFESLVTAGPVTPLGENQDLTGDRRDIERERTG